MPCRDREIPQTNSGPLGLCLVMVVKLLFTAVSPDSSCSNEHCGSHSNAPSSTLSHDRPMWIANAPERERAIQRDHQFASRPSHGHQDPSQELTHAESLNNANLRAQNKFHKTFTNAPLNWKGEKIQTRNSTHVQTLVQRGHFNVW